MIKSRRIRWAGQVAGGEEECIWDFGGKAGRLEATKRTGRMCWDNIKTDLR
jgi:hypothetical protein